MTDCEATSNVSWLCSDSISLACRSIRACSAAFVSRANRIAASRFRSASCSSSTPRPLIIDDVALLLLLLLLLLSVTAVRDCMTPLSCCSSRSARVRATRCESRSASSSACSRFSSSRSRCTTSMLRDVTSRNIVASSIFFLLNRNASTQFHLANNFKKNRKNRKNGIVCLFFSGKRTQTSLIQWRQQSCMFVSASVCET